MPIIKKIERPDFLQINKIDFKCLIIFVYVAMAMAYTMFVLLTCLLPFLATKGSSVIKKKVNET